MNNQTENKNTHSGELIASKLITCLVKAGKSR